MKILESEYTLGEVIPNIALLMQHNAAKFSEKDILCEKTDGEYRGISWSNFYKRIQSIAANLSKFGFRSGDKMIVFSPNRLEMLELEIAVMCCGGISVPIFAYFHKETAEMIIRHSAAKFITVAGILQLSRLSPDLPVKHIFVFDPVEDPRFKNLHSFTELTQPITGHYSLNYNADADEICLNMYTSGTMGTPKCVQLTHRNILSQQAALNQSWTRQFHLNADDRFLSYLPWHHSFGGIFERFTALYHGSTIFLESGFGKSPETLLENWKIVQPTLFFSVPKIYQSLLEIAKGNSNTWDQLFHPDLKFVFTAAASLPKKISDEFEKRNIPVIEGWGLTETAPCCTLTDHSLKRETD
jgi:long-subunit acyl-CoA synthetase (AMP-forming)